MKRTVAETWDSPVADRAAAAWGYEPGTARWWRSSASHVFVLPDPNGKRYLRFVPDAHRTAAGVRPAADLMARLAANGSAVVRPVPSAAGPLVATVETPLGTMHAMVVEAAPGASFDADDLTEPLAAAWGRALAALHRDAARVDADLPTAFGELASARFTDDPELAKAAAILRERLASLPRDSAAFGIVHGDFELDNLAWANDRATAFDFDEAANSWYAADIAYALRDLTALNGRPDPARQALFQAFITGYRSLRPLTGPELAALPLFAAAHAVCSLRRIETALGTPAVREAPWLADLRTHLTDLAETHRDLALTTTADL